ncbi:barstar family protein [Cohnella rhizosphaerae]|uniref:barstar family protein n=1 Tax=Cohnella rhizosphaerae TaxID=1457232 RepID=UPI003B8A7E31
MLTKASKEALEIWSKWRVSPPTSINSWSSFTNQQRKGWLEVVRLYFKRIDNQLDKQNGIYTLDATFIKDSSSFFCALGEAINGPGGYFGFDLLSLEDCLCGGFGVMPPFTLNILNAEHFLEADDVFITKLHEVLSKHQVKLIRL